MTWEDTLKIYDTIVEDCNGFERKGKKIIYTSSNGYIFTLFNKAAEIGIRLPKEETNKFMEAIILTFIILTELNERLCFSTTITLGL